jgi:hypothetical protein
METMIGKATPLPGPFLIFFNALAGEPIDRRP